MTEYSKAASFPEEIPRDQATVSRSKAAVPKMKLFEFSPSVKLESNLRSARRLPLSTFTLRFGTVEPHRTHVKELYTLCYICNDVVRGGSMLLNYPELVQKHPAHLASPLNM